MKVMMKELGEIITGNTPSKKTEEFWNSEDICFIKPDIIADNGINEIVDSNEYISEDARKKARVVGKNSIFITCIGNIGKLGIASDGEYAFNQQINAIIPNDRVQPKYLAYNLLFNKARLVAMANAPVVPIINKSQFGEFTVNIETDIDRQNETVDVLDKLTQIIQQRNKEISALDELIKARFVEMFGHQSHNEKGLPYLTIDDVAEIYLGITHTPTYVNQGVMFISAKNTSGDFLDLSDVKYISREEFEKAPKGSKPQVNDILFSRVGSNLGHPVILEEDLELCTFVSLGFLRTKGKVTSNYLKHWMRDDFFSNQVKEHVKGGGQPNLNTGWLKEFKIIVPNIELQKVFDKFCRQVDKSKAAVQKALDETQLLFDSLMQKYFK